MKFNTVAEAFNFYRNYTNDQLEKRADEIDKMIETDENVDIQSLNVELTGIAEAKRNNDQKSEKPEQRSRFSLIGGRDDAPKSFDRETVLDSPEYRTAFFKSLLGREMNDAEKRAFNLGVEKRSFNSSSNSSAVLPTSTLNEVIKKARTMGGLLAECRAFNMPTKIAIPVGTPGSNASWHTEGDEVTPETATTASVSFDGYEIMKVFSLSAKTRKMSISAFESYLIDELTDCVMATIADSVINGTGSSQGSGLETITWTADTNAVEVAHGSSIAYNDIVNAVALLKRGYSNGAKFAMNNATLYRDIYSLVDSNGRPIFIPDPRNDTVGKLLGYDIVIDDNIDDDVIYFGNFKYFGYNLPEGIEVEVSRESSFRSGLIDYRALAIADTKPIVDEAFVKVYIAEA